MQLASWLFDIDTLMEQEGLAFLHFECVKGPKLVFRKYVRTFTYQTLGDIIENLIPEGESILSLFSEIDHSELHAGMTKLNKVHTCI